MFQLPDLNALLVDDKHVTHIETKANIFKDYFVEQCTLLKNNNVLPINQTFLTQSRLTSFDFSEEEILKIIRALDIHKALNFKIQLSCLIFQIFVKGLILHLCIKRMINSYLKTTDQYPSYISLEKYLGK